MLGFLSRNYKIKMSAKTVFFTVERDNRFSDVVVATRLSFQSGPEPSNPKQYQTVQIVFENETGFQVEFEDSEDSAVLHLDLVSEDGVVPNFLRPFGAASGGMGSGFVAIVMKDGKKLNQNSIATNLYINQQGRFSIELEIVLPSATLFPSPVFSAKKEQKNDDDLPPPKTSRYSVHVIIPAETQSLIIKKA